jgi:hypothetical protein
MLDKAIKSGKEHRKPYYDTRRFDRSCRNHGSCEWCQANRLYSITREKEKANAKLKELFT